MFSDLCKPISGHNRPPLRGFGRIRSTSLSTRRRGLTSERLEATKMSLSQGFRERIPPSPAAGEASTKNWRSSELGESFFRALRRERDSNP